MKTIAIAGSMYTVHPYICDDRRKWLACDVSLASKIDSLNLVQVSETCSGNITTVVG